MKRTIQTGCGGDYRFDQLSPAAYELSGIYGDARGSGFAEVFLSSENSLPLQIASAREIDFRIFQGRMPLRNSALRLIGRRDDLAGAGQTLEIPLPRALLTTGYWELNGIAPSGFFIESIETANSRAARRPWRAYRSPDWHSLFIEPFSGYVSIRLSDQAGSVEGNVSTDAPVAGAPVYLWPVSDQNRRMLGGYRQVLSDIKGRFRFDTLPPGDYRVLSTFDVTELTLEAVEESRAVTVAVSAGKNSTVDCKLWQAP
jgi:hypothetical protein